MIHSAVIVNDSGSTANREHPEHSKHAAAQQNNDSGTRPFNGESDTWSYDGIGNRLTNTVNGTTANYTYQKLGSNPNNWQRLLSEGTNSYAYDANGNTASQSGYTFGWDYDNRMNSIAGTPNATYTYDYSGRRSSKTVSGATTTDLYDGLNLIAETTSGSPTYHLFGPAIDEPLASSNTASVIYDAVDALGSIALSADATGNVQNSYTYDGWGASRSSSESIPQPFRYTSREVGDASGQLFYRARFVTPSIGRFLSEDPVLVDPSYTPLFARKTLFTSAQVAKREPHTDSLTLGHAFGPRLSRPPYSYYTYASNNPVAFLDPTGELTRCQKVGLGTFGRRAGFSFGAMDLPLSISVVGCLTLGPASGPCLAGVLGVFETTEIVTLGICGAAGYQAWRECERRGDCR